MFKFTVSADSMEELNKQLIAYVGALPSDVMARYAYENHPVMSLQATQAASETTAVEDEKDTAPTGRRGGRRQAENKAGEDAAQEPTGRRSRGAEKDNLVNDNEEQAELRQSIVDTLQALADHEPSHGKVNDALKRVGSKTVKDIPSELLQAFFDDVQPLLDEANSAGDQVEDDPGLRKSLVADLKDLQDVVVKPENEGEDKDVTDTLKSAWKEAGVSFRGSVTDPKHIEKISNDKLEAFGQAVTKLIAKYFG